MTVPDVMPVATAAAAPPRRLLPWSWTLVLAIGAVAVAALTFLLVSSATLDDAQDHRDAASTLLARSRATHQAAAKRVARDRAAADAQAGISHQILDRNQHQITLSNQLGALSRQSIAAVVNDEVETYNATRRQINALIEQYNAETVQINALLGQLSGSPFPPEVPSHPPDV